MARSEHAPLTALRETIAMLRAEGLLDRATAIEVAGTKVDLGFAAKEQPRALTEAEAEKLGQLLDYGAS